MYNQLYFCMVTVAAGDAYSLIYFSALLQEEFGIAGHHPSHRQGFSVLAFPVLTTSFHCICKRIIYFYQSYRLFSELSTPFQFFTRFSFSPASAMVRLLLSVSTRIKIKISYSVLQVNSPGFCHL